VTFKNLSMVSLRQPFWLNNLEDSHLSIVDDLPQTAEVVVIGGGLTGVSTAYWLSALGIPILLLDRGDLASGATGRNGGHIMADPGINFARRIQQLGLAPAMGILRFVRENFRLLHEFVEVHAIDCDLYTSDLVTLAMNSQQAEYLQKVYGTISAYGLATDFWDSEMVSQKTHSQAFLAGIVRPNHGQFWPAKLVKTLAELASQKGAQLAIHTAVEGIDRHSDSLTIKTTRGDIQAAAVVYATNAYTHHLLPELQEIIVPIRGQAVATEKVPRLWDFDWSANDGYEYAIQRQDGRIILGGMRWRSPTQEVGLEDDATIEPTISQSLRTFLSNTFAALRDIKIEYEWTGIMGFTADENPLIGKLPHRPGEYIAAGFTGHGMSFAFLTGKMLAELIAGRDSVTIPKAFSPERFGSR